ncbi:dipeptidase [Falsiroseomonas oryzae]|uniref:dipeptidase n=1 Tax=Falsiroseomonas oryzae TaxID=2766473 RepID=UPI0022EA3BEC|nr:dipeptidase [Roseomonas sp. MO-31]
MPDPEAARIHAATLTLDTHVDIPWPDTPDPAGDTQRRVDFPKMRRGGLGAVVFIAYLPQGPLTAEGHAGAAARAEAMLRHIRATGEGAPADRAFCADAPATEAAKASGRLAVLSAVENGYAMGEDLSRLALWKSLGAIYVTLTHNGHNLLSDSAIPRKDLGDGPTRHGGLSALGRAAIAEMNRVGLLVDVSHASRDAMLQAAEASRTPIVATHACCRALRDHPRNLDDAQLDALKAVAGLVQITAVPAFLRDPPAGGGNTQASVADYVDHVDHAVRRIGIEHVGLSSDFDGGGGLSDWPDAARSRAVTAELHRRGYGAREIGLLWSGNFLRLMRLAALAAR